MLNNKLSLVRVIMYYKEKGAVNCTTSECISFRVRNGDIVRVNDHRYIGEYFVWP
jgi:hypothetical protein